MPPILPNTTVKPMQLESGGLFALKATLESRRMLRIIAAHTEEPQWVVLERLLAKECQRVTRKVSGR